MAKLVFDIETIGLPLEGFDATQSEYLFRDAESLMDPNQRQERRAEIQRFFSLWPLTGQVVRIAISNVDSLRSKVLFLAGKNEAKEERALTHSVEFVPSRNEGNC